MMSNIMDLMLHETAKTMVEAFENRARRIYGPGGDAPTE